jgi:hypothetical protein
MPITLLALVILKIVSHHLPRLDWTAVSHFTLPVVSGIIGILYHAQLYSIEMGDLQTFSLWWSTT